MVGHSITESFFVPRKVLGLNIMSFCFVLKNKSLQAFINIVAHRHNHILLYCLLKKEKLLEFKLKNLTIINDFENKLAIWTIKD